MTAVGCCRLADWDTPPDTLNIGNGRRVGALLGIWVERWVTLEVDVESYTAGDVVALGGTSERVVAVQGGVSKVRGGGCGGFKVGEVERIATWDWCAVCISREWLVALKGIWCIRAESISVMVGLDRQIAELTCVQLDQCHLAEDHMCRHA